MARGGTVVQAERLRDQVYRLIRDDIKKGVLKPGQRIVEGDLAERYQVSRTPVREALFQLARDGLLASGIERGYTIPVDTPVSAAARHEVRDLLDPRLAYHAATEGTAEQRRALQKAHEKQVAAHEADKLTSFVSANIELRQILRSMCRNNLLAKCSAMIDDQAQTARRAAFAHAQYRQFEIDSDATLLEAILAGDGPRAERIMQTYIDNVRQRQANIVKSD